MNFMRHTLIGPKILEDFPPSWANFFMSMLYRVDQKLWDPKSCEFIYSIE